MNTKRKLEKWGERFEAMGAKAEKWREAVGGPVEPQPTDHATVAADYPEAWRDLQKRRRVLKWANITSLSWLALMVALAFARPLSALVEPATCLLVLVYLPVILALLYYGSMFRCPRCGEYFTQPGGRGADHVLTRPRSACQHCRLKIGSEPSG